MAGRPFRRARRNPSQSWSKYELYDVPGWQSFERDLDDAIYRAVLGVDKSYAEIENLIDTRGGKYGAFDGEAQRAIYGKLFKKISAIIQSRT